MGKFKERLITPYDTTLRDGSQDPRARLSIEKKLDIARKLDEWGMPYIEGGWPGANDLDTEFFREAHGLLQTSQLVAFCKTAPIGVNPEDDDLLKLLLDSNTEVVTLVGKTWLQHVKRALRTEGLPNLETIYQSVAFLTGEGREVFFDAEHWFDGYRQNRQYALDALRAAYAGGARTLILCDTRGGSTPESIYRATKEARKSFPDVTLGIHVHNDGGLAVSSSIAGVKAGATQVQGTINGVGERTGNVDLCVFLATAEYKYNQLSTPHLDLTQLTPISRFIEEQNEIYLPDNNPYTGRQAFTHKAGLHVSGMERDPESYEHIDPPLVGNRRYYVMSEQGGSTNIDVMARKHGFELSRNDPSFTTLVNEMKRIKVLGDAQEYLLLHQELGSGILPFSVLDGSGVEDKRGTVPRAELIVQVNGDKLHAESLGNGQINAFDNALKKALVSKYPEVNEITIGDRPEDYQVTGSKNGSGTGSAEEVEVFVRLVCKDESWTSRVRGTDQQRAGEDALVDGYRFFILKSRLQSELA